MNTVGLLGIGASGGTQEPDNTVNDNLGDETRHGLARCQPHPFALGRIHDLQHTIGQGVRSWTGSGARR